MSIHHIATNRTLALEETVRGKEALALEDMMMLDRKLWLTCPINAESMNELLKQLMYLEQRDPGKEITLYINSGGGEVISGLIVFDYIRMMRSPVKTVCTGTAASMASILFLAGTSREMFPHSQLMIHDPSYGSGDFSGLKPDEIQVYLDSLKQIRTTLVDIISERSGLPKKTVLKKTRCDTYLTAEEAVEMGLATAVIRSL